MADILKITAPLVNKNTVQPNRQSTDPAVPFNLQDITKVIKSNPQSELLGQNNTLLQKDEGASILMNLLKDPAVTVQFLKNIFMLQEIINLLPVNNSTVTQEIQQLFNALLISPDQIVEEMLRQEYASTVFKGDLFDFLRNLIAEQPQLKSSAEIANLLKSINGILSKQDVLDSVANSLQFLSESLTASSSLSQRLQELSLAFRNEDAAGRFSSLKQETLALLKEVENSILYSPKLAKVVPIVIYNLSRFQDNPDFLGESLTSLMMFMNGAEQKNEFRQLVADYLATFTNNHKNADRSHIMNIIADIISRQDKDASSVLLGGEKIEKIIHSLLSSPCNFTPLLHFVIPVEYLNMKSFAEFWIDPNDTYDRGPDAEQGQRIHMLIVFDISGIGQFEAELWVQDERIRFMLFCPEEYLSEFSALSGQISKVVQDSDYKFEQIIIDKLERQRSLMDVFKTLPYKRTGVDVKI
ncbi:antitoxin [Hydrogenoanaerobacterium sp.]|uniref:antitoxin n=1 Tax=Hydrogenoanaerobacterium sp. TaxID=2953763 RepID=UPI002896888D|nr:antitoxin [Hydrogenoanaerobacterium sp.]